MRNIVWYLILIILGAFILLSSFYLHRVKLYQPLRISVVPNEANVEKIAAIGITPLLQQYTLPLDFSNRAYLFNDVLLAIDTGEIPKIHSILIQNGSSAFILNQKMLSSKRSVKTDIIEVRFSEYSWNNGSGPAKIQSVISVWLRWSKDSLSGYMMGLYNFFSSFGTLNIIVFGFIVFGFSLVNLLDTSRWQPSKVLFYLSLFFFLFIQAYGLWFYQLRMQGEASLELVRRFSTIDYEAPILHRFAYLLNKWLINPALDFDLQWSWIGRIYCFNDALFYLLVAAAVILFAKTYEYAAVILATPVITYGSSFYSGIGCELFLSGALMTLYVAVSKREMDTSKRNLLLAISSFFVIWSHPITMILYFVYFTFLYNSKKLIMRDKWILLFVCFNMAIRVSLLTDYDSGSIAALNIGNKINVSHLVSSVLEQTNIFIIALFIVLFISLLKKKNYIQLFAFTGTTIMLLYLYSSGNNSDFTKYMFPIHWVLVIECIVFCSKSSSKFSYLFLFTVLAGHTYNLINSNHNAYYERAQLINELTTYAYQEDKQHSKWFWPNSHLQNSETLVFSAFQNLPTAVNIVYAYEGIKEKIDTIAHNEILIEHSTIVPIKKMNINYGNSTVYEGAYKELRIERKK